MLVIRHLTGPLKGKEETIDSDLDKVTFGRKIDCNIVYPDEENIVAREHFALVRKPPGAVGHWTVDLYGEPYVAINGVAADQGQKLSQDSIFELGGKGGPSFQVHIEDAGAAGDNLRRTLTQEEAEPPRVIAGRARKTAFVGIAVAAIAAVTAGYYYHHTSQLQIASDVRDHLVHSTFLVVVPDSGGTAFPIGPHLLATNSHVGELADKMRPGEKMFVRSPGPNGKLYEVTDHLLHPGYRALDGFLRQDFLRFLNAQLLVPGYDVALLRVKEDLPADTILPLATSAELEGLKPGSVVATAGYPSEGIVGSEAQKYGATPELHIGEITGLTDFFFLPTDFAHAQLLHHSLPSAGGASGSPIVDRNGHVIALLNAGNSYSPGPNQARVSSGALINYGQRVDMLQHLLAGDADGEIAQDQKYWAEKITKLPAGDKVAIKYTTYDIREHDKDKNIELIDMREEVGILTSAARVKTDKGDTQRQISYSIAVSAGTHYVLIAYPYERVPLQMWIYEGGKPLDHVDNQKYYAPYYRYTPAQDGNLDVWLIAPEDQDVKYSFQVEKIGTAGKSN
jgi:hypothetical protein